MKETILLPVRPQGRGTSTQTRWARWQDSATNQRFLSLKAREQGYTVVYVPRQCEEVFLEFVGLMTVYSHLAPRRACPEDVTLAWQRWCTLLRRLTAYFTRRRAGQSGTCPLMEEESHA